MTKFTPWPWRLCHSGLGIFGADGYELLRIPDCDESEGGRPEEDRANATLIAAAPEMMVMLRSCRKFIANNPRPTKAQREAALHNIECLLAKAENRE